MGKRINILALALILCLSLMICIAKGVQGRGDLASKEATVVIHSQKLKIQQTSPFISEQQIIKRLQFTDEHKRIISYVSKGKKLFEEGVILNSHNDFSGAAEKFKEALVYLEKTDHIQAIALTHLNLAICLQTLQEKQGALCHFNVALDISRKNGFKKYEATALQGSGLILNSLNEKDEAIICLERAIEIHREFFDISGEAVDWLIKGIVERTRNPDRARSYFECALRISEEIGDPVLERKSYDYLDQLREYLFIKQSQGEEGSSFTL